MNWNILLFKYELFIYSIRSMLLSASPSSGSGAYVGPVCVYACNEFEILLYIVFDVWICTTNFYIIFIIAIFLPLKSIRLHHARLCVCECVAMDGLWFHVQPISWCTDENHCNKWQQFVIHYKWGKKRSSFQCPVGQKYNYYL